MVNRLETERRDIDVNDARLAPTPACVARDRDAHPALVNAGPIPPQHRLLSQLTDETDAVHGCSVLYARGFVCRGSVREP